MYHYLTDYATHFDIFNKIEFLTQVNEIEKLDMAGNYGRLGPQTGRTGRIEVAS